MAILAVLPLLLMLLLAVGAVLIGRGVRGQPVLSEPHCAKCGYDLRGIAMSEGTRCSECGSDLRRRNAVKWGKWERRPGLVGVGIALLGLLPLAILGLFFARSSVRVAGPYSPGRSTATVLKSLKTTVNQPWDWSELTSRLNAGKLSQAEAAQAVEVLIADLNSRTGGNAQPLVWSGNFVQRVDAAGDVTDEQYLRLAKSFYGLPAVSLPSRVRQGGKIQFRVKLGGPWSLSGTESVRALRTVKTADGREIDAVGSNDRGKTPNPDYLSASQGQDIPGYLRADLPPGDYLLTFVIDCGVLQAQTAPRMVEGRPGQSKYWPSGRARWTEEVTMPLTVVDANESPLRIISDPALDPQRAGAIHVKSLRVTIDGTGKRVGGEISIANSPVACSFEITVRLDGQDMKLGQIVAGSNGSWTAQLGRTIQTLSPTAGSTDVILWPNPAAAEGTPDISSVWGGTIEIDDVPLHRYDLEAGEGK